MKIKLLFFLLIALLFLSIFYSYTRKYSPHDSCSEVEGEYKSDCLKTEFENTLSKFGINAGFELLTFLYDKDSNFPAVCHDFTHLIGESAYQRYKRGERFKLTDATAYCGYGFYHGFILSLFKDGKDKDEAASFCSWANNTISKENTTVSLDCFHGIGHGVVDFGLGDSYSSELLKQVVDSSLVLCEKTGVTEDQVERCKNGVYHSTIDLLTKDSSFLIGPQSIVKFCQTQTTKNQTQCFSASSSFLMRILDEDFAKTTNFVSNNIEENYAKLVIRSLAGYEAYKSNQDKNKMNQNIAVCKNLTQSLKDECIRGLIEGATDFGTPKEEEKEIASFCMNSLWTSEEKSFCTHHALQYFEGYFGKEKKSKLEVIIKNSI